jgi:hypothetical protein
MSPMFRSVTVLTVLAVSQLGCAARLGAEGRAKMGSQGSISCAGGLSGSGTGQASAGGHGSAQASGHGSTSGGGQASGYSGGSGYGSGGATSGAAGGWGGATAHGGANGGSCGCVMPAGGGASAGGATATAGGGAMLPLPGIPQFYGIPLGGAEDVVFVLDRSDSMSGSSTGAPSSPLAALATAGYGAVSAFQATTPSLTAIPTSLSGALSAFSAFSAPLRLGVAPQPAATSKLDAAKAELVSALSTLPDGTRFGVVFFNENVALLAPGLTSMGPSSRWTSVGFVHGIAPSGTTAAVPALREAYAARPRRVVFLSDGLANTGGDSAELLAEARAAMRYGVRFDTVGVGADQDAPTLRAMAAESGGIAVSR